MSPPWVLLHRCVSFIEEGSAGVAGKAAAAIGESPKVASLEEVTAALKPDQVVVDPPEVTSLSMVRHLPKHLLGAIKSGIVSSTDKGLVVLYAGTYRPSNGGYTWSGGYLVYDASSSSLSAIPQLESLTDVPHSVKSLGASAAVLRCSDVHMLAELVTSFESGLPDAHLYLWRSSSTPTGTGETPTGGQWASLPSARQRLPARQWLPMDVCLPLPDELCGPKCFFHIDKAFAFEGCVCWADLLTGFLDFVGYCESSTKAEVTLKTWTLSSDLKEWKEGPGVLVRDLWESESFREMELPKRGWPMNPVLSMDEDEAIYISLCDIEFVAEYDFLGQCTGKQTVLNGHYVLRLDLL